MNRIRNHQPIALLTNDTTMPGPEAWHDVWLRQADGRYVSTQLGVVATVEEMTEDGWEAVPLVALPAPTDLQRRRVAAGVTDPGPERVERAATLLAALEAVGQALGVDPEDWRAVTSFPNAAWDVTARGGAR